GCALRWAAEVDRVTGGAGERSPGIGGSKQARVGLGIGQPDEAQAALVPAGIPEAVFYIVSRIGPGIVRPRHGSRSCREVGKELGGRSIFGDMALLDVVRDLFRVLRIPEVDEADALVGRGVDH